MKHLFVEGNLNQRKGQPRLNLIMNDDKYTNEQIEKSLDKMSRLIDFYEFDVIDGTGFYYLYQEYGFGNNKHNKEEVFKSLSRVVEGKKDNAENISLLSLDSRERNDIGDVFIDVNNNIILCNGKDNLKEMCVELLMRNYTSLGEEWTLSSEARHVLGATDNSVISKLFLLDQTKDESLNKKPIKLIYR